MAIYALGSNGHGQLGVGSTNDVDIPTQAIIDDHIDKSLLRKVAAGGQHTVFLFENGKAYTAGQGAQSCASFDSEIQPDTTIFRATHLPRDARRHAGNERPALINCASTWRSNTLITEFDVVWTAGNRLTGHPIHALSGASQIYGQVSVQKDVAGMFANTRPDIWDFPPHGTSVLDVSGSMDHIVVVLDNGEVHGWGNGSKGQLGEPAGEVWQPRKITDIPFVPARAVCGREFTLIVGSADVGEFIIVGSDKHKIKSSAPDSVADWKDIAAGWNNCHILYDNGTVLSWGSNSLGQLAPPGLPKIERLAAGTEHVVALTADNKVISWGWAKHGNCGLPIPSTTHGELSGHWNEIAVHGKVVAIGAGGATTFIQTDSI